MKNYGLMILSAVLLLWGCQLVSPPSGDNPPSSTVSSIGKTIPASVLKADLSGAAALISASGSTGGSSRGTRAGEADVLTKILEDGSLENVFTVPEDVTLPDIRFLALHPYDGALYVAFKSVLVLPDDLRASMIRIIPEDNSIEIVESEDVVVSFTMPDWSSPQDPVAFTKNGGLFYVANGSDGQVLKGYVNKESKVFSPEAPLWINRFFSDGDEVFLLSYLNGDALNGVIFQTLDPVTGTFETLFGPEASTWIKDAYLQDGKLILSGYNIPDPELTTRRYDGILRLAKTGEAREWTQLYGYARDTGNSNFVANRRQLKSDYFQDGEGNFDPVLARKILAPFFNLGDYPENIRPFEIVDIDKVVLDSDRIPLGVTPTLEHKFWFGLLSRYEGFDTDFFYSTVLRWKGMNTDTQKVTYSSFYPFLGASGLLKPWFFNMIFGNTAKNYYTYEGDMETYLAAVKSENSDWFADISVKDGQNPLKAHFGDVSANLVSFKAWLDATFDYSLKTGVTLNNTDLYTAFVINGEPEPTRLHKIYLNISALYGTPDRYVEFQSWHKGAGETLNKEFLINVVRKFYGGAQLIENDLDLAIGLKVPASWSNSDSNKAAVLDLVFNLGEPRVSSEEAQRLPTKFYDLTSNQGLVDNPYVNLNFDTLFDSFNNLDRFFMADDGSLYGLFTQGLGLTKVIKMTDGPTGSFKGRLVYKDIPSDKITIRGTKAYWVARSGEASGLYSLDILAESPAESQLVSPEDGYLFYAFQVLPGSETRILISALELETAQTKMGLWTADSGITYSDLEGLSIESDFEVFTQN